MELQTGARFQTPPLGQPPPMLAHSTPAPAAPAVQPLSTIGATPTTLTQIGSNIPSQPMATSQMAPHMQQQNYQCKGFVHIQIEFSKKPFRQSNSDAANASTRSK